MINFSLFIIKYEMKSLAMSQQILWKLLIFATWLVRQPGDWSWADQSVHWWLFCQKIPKIYRSELWTVQTSLIILDLCEVSGLSDYVVLQSPSQKTGPWPLTAVVMRGLLCTQPTLDPDLLIRNCQAWGRQRGRQDDNWIISPVCILLAPVFVTKTHHSPW